MLYAAAMEDSVISITVPKGTDIPRKTLKRHGVVIKTFTVGDATLIIPRRMNLRDVWHKIVW